ncbi:MAG: hypothetical protein ACKVUS_00535 [Saprospiraceae bacterium]
MKKQLLFYAIFLLAASLQAQEQKTALIANITGKVALIPQKETAAMELQSGAVVKKTGQLQLAKGSTAVVYCNGQFQKVKGNQTLTLDSICGAATDRHSLDMDNDLGNFMMAAVEMVAVAKHRGDGWSNAVSDPRKGGDGWGAGVSDPRKGGDGWLSGVSDPRKGGDGYGAGVSDPRKGGDGWGGKGTNITPIMPHSKVSADMTMFSWSKPAGTNTYHLIILDERNKMVHMAEVRDTFARVNLRDMKPTIGGKYHWKVTTTGSKPMASPEMVFTIGSKEELAAALSNASTSNIAKSSKSRALRGLAEAIALEDGKWFYAAQQKYAVLQQKQPDNMVRMMHAAFWMRQGFDRLAQKAAQVNTP